MSWSSKRVFGFLVGALVATSALVGCSGDATIGPDPSTPFIPVSGGASQASGTSNETRAASGAPQQVQVTVGGNVTTGMLPAGVSVTTGEQVGTLDPNTTIIAGLHPTGGRAPGDIYLIFNGQQFPTGVHLNSDGSLSGLLVLPNGFYTVFIQGPLVIEQNGQRLDIQSYVINGEVRNGVYSLPSSVNGQLPVDGGSSFPLRLDVQMPATFANGFVELRVIHANGILHQDRTLVNGFTQFHDLVFGDNSIIPATGVQTVEFSYSPNPFGE
ncbi:MAG TPA: hypothetical protein VK934_02750 [Fimbriimonas sp.]|nr:hypothetical protein [Fimbriimonas sp.]